MKNTVMTVAAMAAWSAWAGSVDPATLGALVDLAVHDDSRVASHPANGWQTNQTPLNLFDGNYGNRVTRWSHPYQIAYTFPSATAVNAYCIASETDAANRAPGTWTFCGSNDFDGTNFDSATWTALDTQTGESGWTNGERRYYAFENETGYRTYAIHVTANAQGGTGNALLAELDMFYVGCDVTVSGNPGNYGPVDYTTTTVATGSTVTRSTFSGEWTDPQGAYTATCTGYKVYTSTDGMMWTEWLSGTSNEVEFTAPRSRVKVEWQYEVTWLVQEVAVYVAPNGSDDASGDSPATAFATISHAIAALGDTGGIVYLADGTYADTGLAASDIVVSTPVKIVGLSADATKVRVNPKAVNYRVFSLRHEGAQLRHLTIGGCGTSTTTDAAEGGSVNMTAGEILDCVITGTFGRNGGAKGSVYMTGGHVARCRFQNCYMRGAGVCVYATGGLIEDCLFAGNAWTGNNDGTFMVDLEGPATLLNCTVTDNHMRAESGVKAGHASSRVVNCIIYGNTSLNSLTGHVWGGNASCFINCVTELGIAGATDCVAADPDFVDAANGDYRISPASPAFDAGTSRAGISTSTVDMGGRTRVVGAAVDIGCYEQQQDAFACGFTVSLNQKITPATATFAASVAGVPGGNNAVEYAWDFGDGTPETVVGTPSVSHVYTVGGTYDVTLAVRIGDATATRTKQAAVRISPAVMYTSPGNRNAAQPYDTEENAAPDLATAVAFAEDGATIVMLAGRYNQSATVKIEKAITVRGATGNPEDVVLYNTVQNANVRVLELHHSEAFVSGITMSSGRTNANNGHGGTLFFNNGGGTVSNCVVRSGAAAGWASYAGGVGMYNGLLTHSVITGTFVSSPANNATGSDAGLVVYISGANARMENCLVTNVAANLTAATQDATSGCIGPLVAVARGRIANCTVAVSYKLEKAAPSTMPRFDGGCAIYCAANGSAVNCVATGFSRYDDTVVPFGGPGTFDHCAGDAAVDGLSLVVGTPAEFFTNPGNGDYHPQKDSLLVNVGATTALASETDLDGKPRAQGRAMDIGCYEFEPEQCMVILLR